MSNMTVDMKDIINIGDAECLGELLKLDSKLVHTHYDKSICEYESPLHLAAACGHVAITQVLLENGATVNQLDASGRTPLWYAVVRGESVDVTQQLLEAGADPNHVFEQDSLLHWAVKGTNPPLFLRLLLQYGAQPNHVNRTMCTPLSTATTLGLRDAVMVLLAHGADPHSDCTNTLGAIAMAEVMKEYELAAEIRAWLQAQEAYQVLHSMDTAPKTDIPSAPKPLT